MPVGTVRIRTRHKRGGEQRAWIKVADPNTWILRAHDVWIRANGVIPRGMVVHHRNEDALDDRLENLAMITKAEHLAEHRDAYSDRAVSSFTKTRRRLRWSTRSATKRTGRPPKYSESDLALAKIAVERGLTPNAAAARFGISRTTMYRIAHGGRRG